MHSVLLAITRRQRSILGPLALIDPVAKSDRRTFDLDRLVAIAQENLCESLAVSGAAKEARASPSPSAISLDPDARMNGALTSSNPGRRVGHDESAIGVVDARRSPISRMSRRPRIWRISNR
jgi:hypothetical protein